MSDLCDYKNIPDLQIPKNSSGCFMKLKRRRRRRAIALWLSL